VHRESGGDDERQHHVHEHAREQDHQPGPERLRLEPPVRRDGLGPERQHRLGIVIRIVLGAGARLLAAPLEDRRFLVVLRGHAHVAAERQRRQHVLGLAAAALPQGGAEADGEARGVHAEPLGGDEVPELMNEDHDPEHEDRGENR
jgi:hypothetical protein